MPTTLAHISDLHFGRLDAPVAEALVADLQRCSPSLLVISGDLTQRARPSQFRDAAAFLARLPRPQLVIPGNHDVPLWNIVRRFFFPLQSYRKIISDNLTPIWQDDRTLVIGVNTARSFTQASGWMSKEQLQNICRTFAQRGPDVMKVLVTHHPFIPSPLQPRGDIVVGAPAALGELERCGTDVLLAGHLHRAYHDDVRSFHTACRRSIISIQAGTATSTRRRGEPNAFNWIELDKDLVTVDIRRWNGDRFESASRGRYRRIGPHGPWVREEGTIQSVVQH